MTERIGTLRHSAKHRALVLQHRDRFPRMVTHRFLVRLSAGVRLGQINTLVVAPKGSRIEHWQDLRRNGVHVVVTHPAHTPVVIDPQFVEEIRG